MVVDVCNIRFLSNSVTCSFLLFFKIDISIVCFYREGMKRYNLREYTRGQLRHPHSHTPPTKCRYKIRRKEDEIKALKDNCVTVFL